MRAKPSKTIRLFLCGDVMTGRGIDQILSSPGNPKLHESYVKDARRYVALAESINGKIPRPITWNYIWGDALTALDQADTDIRIINLETAITSSNDYWRGKSIHYRMHPRNIPCLTSAAIHCCCLANNHILDWGYEGLTETLITLDRVGIAHAGAGCDSAAASEPAVLEMPEKGRVLVFSYGMTSSGIPQEWAATSHRPGVNLLENASESTAKRIAREMIDLSNSGDAIVASIHWGGNWGYAIRQDELDFGRSLIDHGIHVVHGHSSHHVKTVEIHRGGLLLYGCGDFINDYEGIRGHEIYRPDLAIIYLVDINLPKNRISDLQMLPMKVRRFRLERASIEDAAWLTRLLKRLGSDSFTRVNLEDDYAIAASSNNS